MSCLNATFALQHGGFTPHEWLASKGLLCRLVDAKAIYFYSVVADLDECVDEEIIEAELRRERIKEKEVSNGC